MKRSPKYNIGFLLLMMIYSDISWCQDKSLTFKVGGYYASEHFLFPVEHDHRQWQPWINNEPAFSAGLFYQNMMARNLSLKIGLDYLRSRVSYSNTGFTDNFGNENIDTRPTRSFANHLFPGIGLSYNLPMGKEINLMLGYTLTTGFHFSSYDWYVSNHGRPYRSNRYSKTDYHEGMLYGNYLSIGVNRIWRDWIFSLSANAGVYQYFSSKYKPKFLGGLNLGVGYVL